MSDTNYAFNFCRNILINQEKRKTIQNKKGDVIRVPEFNQDIISLLPCTNRNSTDTLIPNHDKLSNSTISDFGNSFNSDMRAFLSKINFLN